MGITCPRMRGFIGFPFGSISGAISLRVSYMSKRFAYASSKRVLCKHVPDCHRDSARMYYAFLRKNLQILRVALVVIVNQYNSEWVTQVEWVLGDGNA